MPIAHPTKTLDSQYRGTRKRKTTRRKQRSMICEDNQENANEEDEETEEKS